MKTLINIIAIVFTCIVSLQGQTNSVLTRVCSSSEMEPYTTGYKDASGNMVIPMHKYVYCFTEVFDKIAFVLHKAPGDTLNRYYAINRAEDILFEVATWDNGPDKVQDGLFRIIVDGKMGFANMNGDVVVPPTFSSALPFSEGLAAFCTGGVEVKDGEYTKARGGKWGFVNTNGIIKISAQFDEISSFREGKATVKKNGEVYQIDINGNYADSGEVRGLNYGDGIGYTIPPKTRSDEKPYVRPCPYPKVNSAQANSLKTEVSVHGKTFEKGNGVISNKNTRPPVNSGLNTRDGGSYSPEYIYEQSLKVYLFNRDADVKEMFKRAIPADILEKYQSEKITIHLKIDSNGKVQHVSFFVKPDSPLYDIDMSLYSSLEDSIKSKLRFWIPDKSVLIYSITLPPLHISLLTSEENLFPQALYTVRTR